MRYLIAALLLVCSTVAQAAVLIQSPNGTLVANPAVKTLAQAAVSPAAAGKTVVVTSALSASFSNISSATVPGGVWPSDRALKVEKGGSIANTTAFTINGNFEAGLFPVFTGAGTVTFNNGISLHPEWFGALRDGATNDYSALQKALTAGAGSKVVLSAGSYNYGTTLVVPNQTTLVGSGIANSRLVYGGTSDAIQINNPINSSTAAYITIKDLSVQSTTKTTGKAGIADVGSSYLYLENLQITGNDYDILLDQSELVRIRNCIILPVGKAGIWLVNGPKHTIGASYGYTNQIVIDGCQFNSNTAGVVAIADDGGINHVITNNNFNACDKQIRFVSVSNILIEGNEFEGAVTSAVSSAVTYLDGLSYVTGLSQACTINNNLFTTTGAGIPLVIATDSLYSLTYTSNSFRTTPPSGVTSSGLNLVFSLVAFNNVTFNTVTGQLLNHNNRVSAGFTSPFAVGYNNVSVSSVGGDLEPFTTVWSSGGTAPAIGNGTLVSEWARNGKSVVLRVFLIAGSTTTFGTGEWYFSLPDSAVGTVAAIGTGTLYDSSTNTYYVLASSVVTPTNNLVRLIANGAVSTVNPTNPITMANGDYIQFSIEYTTTGK